MFAVAVILKKDGGDEEAKLSSYQEKKCQTHSHRKIPLTLLLMLHHSSEPISKAGRHEVVFSS